MKVLQKSIFTLLICINAFLPPGNSQETLRDSLRALSDYPRHQFGVTIGAILNSSPAIQLNYAARISERTRFKSEFGYVFASVYGNLSNGFRFKPGLHYMLSQFDNGGLSIGMNLNYRYTTGRLRDVINIRSEDYLIFDSFIRRRTLLGAEFAVGRLVQLSDFFNFEIGFGLGVQSLTVRDIGRSDIIDSSFTFDLFPQGTYLLPLSSFHLSLNYTIM